MSIDPIDAEAKHRFRIGGNAKKIDTIAAYFRFSSA
jgi:hypothetical protein